MKFRCEICGGTLVVDITGNFATCENCGLKYSSDKLRKFVNQASIHTGDVLYGTVVRLMTFGAFVELGVGQSGLVHISKLSSTHVSRIEDVCQIGDIVKVLVTDIDEKGRINLSIKDAVNLKPNKVIEEKECNKGQNRPQIHIGDVLYGTVKRTMQFGAFVELGGGQEGLVHISKLSSACVGKVEDFCQIGDTVKVLVTDIDEKGRINLSIKDAIDLEVISTMNNNDNISSSAHMKRCSECGTFSTEETLFCYVCGKKFPKSLGAVQEIKRITIIEKEAEKISTHEVDLSTAEQIIESPHQKADPEEREEYYIDICCPYCHEELSYTNWQIKEGELICPVCDARFLFDEGMRIK